VTAKKTYGPHGLSVTLWREHARIRAQWRVAGRRQKRSWANTPDNWRVAQAWAEGFAERRQLQGLVHAPCTLRELWTRFVDANDHLRPRTVELYRQRWRKLELFAGRDLLVDDVSTGMLDGFRAALRRSHAANQVREIIRTAKVVFNWGDERELVRRNRVGRYVVPRSKDEPTARPAEYRVEDFRALQRTLDPQDSRQWRAWALLTLVGNQGVRVNAALRLRWTDIGADAITWPGETDKTGRTWSQPLRAETRQALAVARYWATEQDVTSPWVFYSSHDVARPWTVQGFWYHLQEAERAAGVPHHRLRAAHGFRRMVVTEIVTQTGNLVQALQFVGDRDLKQARSYVRERWDELVAVARRLDEEGPAAAPAASTEEPNVRETVVAEAVAESHRSDLNRRPPASSQSPATQESPDAGERPGPTPPEQTPKGPRTRIRKGPGEAPGPRGGRAAT
jgi:site-specific recombinase XerD